MNATPPVAGATPGFAPLFTPKLVTVFREGYRLAHLRADLTAGLTVAIVALPLSMAIAIASGTTPERGLITSIIGGFIISAIGGSRFQIGGPAGAFIVLVAAAVDRHGIEGVFLATIIAGLILIAVGLLRLGTYIKFIPYPVTVGFTAGIATIIFASQIKDLLGLHLAGREPGPILPKLAALGAALPSASPAAIALAVATILIVVAVKRHRPTWPGMLIAVALAATVTAVLALPVETIGTRFGGIPRALPAPHLPPLSFDTIIAVLPDAIAFALLGAIESLLSAVVADGMTGRRHRSNCELVAQGVANIASALFGGICVTGAVARTATSIRAGAHGPVAGMLHALFLLGFMLIAAPLASYIPLAALAGVLAVVAFAMAERHAFAGLLRASRGDAVVLLATYLLTVFRDLTEAIVVGVALGCLMFIDRMARAATVETAQSALSLDDRPDVIGPRREPYSPEAAGGAHYLVYRLTGALFFGVASTIGAALDAVADQRRHLVLDFAAVPFLDSSAANAIAGVARRAAKLGVALYLTGTNPIMRQTLVAQGVRPPLVHYRRGIKEAVADLGK